MGLDTSHDCYHGSYGGFNAWRDTICRVAGYGELNWRKGHGGELPWTDMAKDPLRHLLKHSDCDGQISWRRAGPLADRLEQILRETTPEGGFVAWSNEYHLVKTTERFIRGLRAANKAKEPVLFR